eukprot:880010-Rhodomonas_salina.1
MSFHPPALSLCSLHLTGRHVRKLRLQLSVRMAEQQRGGHLHFAVVGPLGRRRAGSRRLFADGFRVFRVQRTELWRIVQLRLEYAVEAFDASKQLVVRQAVASSAAVSANECIARCKTTHCTTRRCHLATVPQLMKTPGLWGPGPYPTARVQPCVEARPPCQRCW